MEFCRYDYLIFFVKFLHNIHLLPGLFEILHAKPVDKEIFYDDFLMPKIYLCILFKENFIFEFSYKVNKQYPFD